MFMKFLALLVMALIVSPVFSRTETRSVSGRWRIEFALTSGEKKHLIFEAKTKGAGTLLGLDTAEGNKQAAESLPAVWSETANERVTFSGDIELPLGTCCRELGTLLLKGSFDTDNSLKGRAIFITNTTDDENFVGYRSDVGTFTATREP
jgi:hypothetical protein